jgi:predicted NAD/FAD-binding protein
VKIAVIGSGISGLVAAHQLAREHEVEVFEAETRIGGHTHTVDVELGGAHYAIDTGFIVYNERTYPHFTRLLRELGVETQPSDMSFGLSCERTGLEWGSRGLRGVFAQPSNALRPSFQRMLSDIFRFNRESRPLLNRPEEKATLAEYLHGGGYSAQFVEHYVVPMGAAIWSADPQTFLQMPAATFVRFFHNHGLLESNPSLPWRVVKGGSASYLEALAAPFRASIHVGCAVSDVRRHADSVELFAGSSKRVFDQVVIAVHSDQALRLLADATAGEQQVLGAMHYQRNEVVLHTDESVMPRSKRAWASWNYRIPRASGDRVFVTYDMNRLQSIDAPHRFLVTLNDAGVIDPDRVLQRFVYEHPVFDADAIQAQSHHAAVSGHNRTHFCGAYWGFGFHEDGVRSGLAVARALGVEA